MPARKAGSRSSAPDGASAAVSSGKAVAPTEPLDEHPAGVCDVIDVLGAVIVVGWLQNGSGNVELRALAHGVDRVVDVSDSVVTGTGGAGEEASTGRRLFAALIDAEDGDRSEAAARYSVRIAVDGDAETIDDLSPRHVGLDDLLNCGVTALLYDCLRKSDRPEIARIVGRTVSKSPPDALKPYCIEAAVRGGKASVVAGWIGDLQTRQICLVDSNLRTCSNADQMVVRSRPDIHKTLQVDGHRTCGGDGHGFVALLEDARDGGADFYVAETDSLTGHVTFFGPFDKPARSDEAVAADLVSEPFGDVFLTPPDIAEALFRPVLERPDQDLLAERFVYDAVGSNGELPTVSIIIPFFGDAFFLSCVFHLHRSLDRRFEVIVVVDDPEIWSETKAAFDRRRTAIRIRTVLLRNRVNYGYAGANNLGAQTASGDVLVLMNSDVLVKNVEALRRAGTDVLEAAGQGRDLIVGFLLLYEDQSIQHIGIDFVRAPVISDMFVARHPMKGLPLELVEAPEDRTVEAATGALLAISADLYQRLGGFDPVYLRGDFEDADLCLRARAAGATIKVQYSTGLYHLERQSYSQMAGDALRRMITYINCITFNRRWGSALAGKNKSAKRRRRRITSSVARQDGRQARLDSDPE